MTVPFKRAVTVFAAFSVLLAGCAQGGVAPGGTPVQEPQASQVPDSIGRTPEPEATPEPIPEPEVTSPESGEYPVGTWLELTAGEDADIYYVLGGEETRSIAESDYQLYEGPVLMPPYESRLFAYCKDADGKQSPTVEREYSVYDSAYAQHEYENDDALMQAFQPVLASLVTLREDERAFASPEEMTPEQIRAFALQNAPEENLISHGLTLDAPTNYVLHKDTLNKWVQTFFDGRAAAPAIWDMNPKSDYLQAVDGTTYDPGAGYLSWGREQITYTPHVLSLSQDADRAELVVCLDMSAGRTAQIVGYEEDTTSGNYIGLPGDPYAPVFISGSFRVDSVSAGGTSSHADYDALARMNFGMYEKVYRYVFTKHSNGGWMPESCSEIPVDMPCYAPQVRPSVSLVPPSRRNAGCV